MVKEFVVVGNVWGRGRVGWWAGVWVCFGGCFAAFFNFLYSFSCALCSRCLDSYEETLGRDYELLRLLPLLRESLLLPLQLSLLLLGTLCLGLVVLLEVPIQLSSFIP
jgi:hypothetical protein